LAETQPSAPSHASPPPFEVAQGQLRIGGQPISRLAARVGSTPFYAYDRRLLSERVALLRRSCPDRQS
jgi:diaminopimelate decarboxylase